MKHRAGADRARPRLMKGSVRPRIIDRQCCRNDVPAGQRRNRRLCLGRDNEEKWHRCCRFVRPAAGRKSPNNLAILRHVDIFPCQRHLAAGADCATLRNQVTTEDEIVRQIAVVVQSLNGTILHYDGPLTASTSIVRDLKLDSLAVMDFVMAVETKFETIIPVESIADVETIGDLAALLRSQPVQSAG